MIKIKKILWMTLGFVGLGLGALGAILPLLPSFGFLVIAMIGFGKSSERLDTWFKSTNLYKKNIESFVKGKGMTKTAKCKVLLIITGLMAFSFYMMKNVPTGRVILFIVWIFHVWYFIFRVKNYEEGIN